MRGLCMASISPESRHEFMSVLTYNQPPYLIIVKKGPENVHRVFNVFG